MTDKRQDRREAELRLNYWRRMVRCASSAHDRIVARKGITEARAQLELATGKRHYDDCKDLIDKEN
jgi:hypothetical protein